VFPDLYLQFLSELKMEEAGSIVQGKVSVAPLKEDIYLSLDRRAPVNLWQEYLKSYFHYEEDGTRVEDSSLQVHKKDAFAVAVRSYRIPFKDFSNAIKLRDVIKYAELTEDLNVFKSDTIVYAILQYKKPLYTGRFKKQLVIYFCYLVLCVLWGYAASTTRHLPWQDLLVHDPVQQSLAWGVVSVILSPVVLGGAAFYMKKELSQMQLEYKIIFNSRSKIQRTKAALKHYFSSVWNFIDCFGFGLTCIACVMYFVRYPLMHQLTSAAITMLCFKLLYYARALPSWSLVVRTMLVVIQRIVNILTVLFILICGVSSSYLILLGAEYNSSADTTSVAEYFRNPLIAWYTVFLFLFGQLSPIDVTGGPESSTLAMLLLLVFMIISVILLLNILIAKMGDAYGDVRERAELESTCEIARIIYELEEDRNPSKFLPWLHVLRPVQSDLMGDIPEDSDLTLSEASRDIQRQLDTLEDRITELSKKIAFSDNSTSAQLTELSEKMASSEISTSAQLTEILNSLKALKN